MRVVRLPDPVELRACPNSSSKSTTVHFPSEDVARPEAQPGHGCPLNDCPDWPSAEKIDISRRTSQDSLGQMRQFVPTEITG